ncbi:hypothetical protein PVAP13_9KG003212 [Panicum virgatum]|uniref:Uncharacterized protein n=1 Tax=Panicum virgatum TaxID=38727 RepID=A0A8T0N381_PANVG|nr:hypothetical protein PVAP13_9KG003212 [Panicum virgatum]
MLCTCRKYLVSVHVSSITFHLRLRKVTDSSK